MTEHTVTLTNYELVIVKAALTAFERHNLQRANRHSAGSDKDRFKRTAREAEALNRKLPAITLE